MRDSASVPVFDNVDRILVIKLRHIGDVLLTVPVFRALRERFPNARLTALVNRGTEEVLAGNPLVDEIIVYDRSIKQLGSMRKLSAEISFLRGIRARNFDMTVDLTSGDRPAIISFASGARYRLAVEPKPGGLTAKRLLYTHLTKPNAALHTVLQNLQAVRPVGIASTWPVVDFFIPAAARERVRELFAAAGITLDKPLVHIHPTSRWLFKCWNDAAMAEVISWLLGRGIQVVVTSSPERKELEKAARIMELVPQQDGLLTLLGKTNIKELAAISEAADLFFGVDSAPMHIAAALNTPILALFGPSGAFHWGPWANETAMNPGETSPYPARSGTQSFGRHTVLQSAEECVPCGQDGCNGSKLSRCLEEISAEEVKRLLAGKLQKTGNRDSGTGNR